MSNNNNNKYLGEGIAAAVITFFTIGIGITNHIMQVYATFDENSYGALIVAAIANILVIASFILTILALVKNKKLAFVASILNFVAAVFYICALIPFKTYFLLLYTILAFAMSLANLILTLIYWFNAPVKTIKQKKKKIDENKNDDVINNIDKIKMLKSLLDDNILTEQEYQEQKDLILHTHNSEIIKEKDETITSKAKCNFTRKQQFITIISSILVIGIILAIVYPVSISILNKKWYQRVLSIATEESYYYDLDDIEEYFELLPNKYQGINQVKRDYNHFLSYMNTIESDNSEPGNKRNAYLYLKTPPSLNCNWKFEEYLQEHVKTSDLIKGVRWEFENNYLELEDKNEEFLYTNLPSNKDSNKSYYYYFDRNSANELIIGYENQSNSNDKFKAYRIYDFMRAENNIYSIKIYCYKDNKIYTMTVLEQVI